jgi:beta-lactamase class D
LTGVKHLFTTARFPCANGAAERLVGTIKTALEFSVNWYFNELGEQIGNKNMANYMEKLAYGNQKVSNGGEQAWYNGQLKISAIEQVAFIKNILNQNCNGISKDAQRITKQIFPVKTESNYSMYGKPGTGQIDNNKYIGWYIGFIETKTNSYAFALNIFANDVNEIPVDKRQELVKDIFTKLGLLD